MNNIFKNKIKSSQKLLGIWSTVSNNDVIEIFSLSGLDFIILDMEHGNFSKEDIRNSIIICKLNRCLPFVRVPIFDLSNIQSVLDSDCSGIVFPKISSKQEAIKAVSLCKFSPDGNRGFNPFTRFNNYNLFKQKFDNKSLLIIIIIETKEGIENLDEILSVDGIDAIYIGIYDLSKEYNFKNTTNKKLLKIVDRTLNKINSSGKASGLMVNNKDYLNLAKKFKSKFLTLSVDTEIIGSATKNIIKTFK
jgi:4-hydroxy-2-oxoheptanedioate aldolase